MRHPHLIARVNGLRAGVLGADDGIVSVAGLLIATAAATSSRIVILNAGIAGLVAGAVSMALGEYVSVGTQRDAMKAEGTTGTAAPNPWQAAASSAVSFVLGALLPLLAMLLSSPSWRVPVTFAAVPVALAITGMVSARLGGLEPRRAMARIVLGGALAMAITYGVGRLAGASGI